MSDWLGRALRAFSIGAGLRAGHKCRERSSSFRRTFAFEALEPRLTLAAAGLVPVGSQPAGSLSGKIVFVSPGHGYQYQNGAWQVGRPLSQGIVEDFGNQDQATAFADYLFRAGATVVPMRPIGHQTNEVVLDNDLPAVTYTGNWTDVNVPRNGGLPYYDEDYDVTHDTVAYRTAATSATETATATFTPAIPADGMYPVYAWAAAGTDRTSQLYEINSSDGQTQVRIDHSMIGNGWIYLGTYHFAAGSSSAGGSVVISNQGATGKVVVADAIRFGNGMGDVLDGPNGPGAAGGTISGRPREDESSIIWDVRSVGQGVNIATMFHTNATTFDPNVSAPAILAQYMFQNSNPFGSGVYIAIHSNASGGSGTSRGALGLISNEGSPTPHQASLAESVGSQINNDMTALNGTFEYNWGTTTTNTLTDQFGEINADDFTNSNGVVEMDATLAEVAYHDNVQDAAIMRDPKGRDQIARSLYEGVVEYFTNWGGLNRPTTLPSAPNSIRAVSNANGQVTVSWAAGPSNPATVYGSLPTGFRIYASTDGYGFDGGTLAVGDTTTSATLTGLDPTRPYYFKVVAINSGGESEPTEVAVALPSGGSKQVLIVNGFDRFDRTQDFQYVTQLANGGSTVTANRVYPRYNNSFNYVTQTESAIQAAKPGVHVDSTSNEAVISGAVNLSDYDTVIWILGNESTANHTFDATEQAKVTSFIGAGGNLFLSGSEIGWDLDQNNNGRPFYENTLKANYVADDANTYTATGTAGGIFAGITGITFSDGATFNSLDSQLYNVAFPDVIAPQVGAISALTYSGGTGGTAAIQVQGTGGSGSIVMLAFPFETITDAMRRQTVMGRALDFFGVAAPVPNADFSGNGVVDAADYVLWRANAGQTAGATHSQGDANDDGAVNNSDYAIWRQQFGTSVGSGSNSALESGGADEGTSLAGLGAVTVAAPSSRGNSQTDEFVAASEQVSRYSKQQETAISGRHFRTRSAPAGQTSSAWNSLLADLAEDHQRPGEIDNHTDELGSVLHHARKAERESLTPAALEDVAQSVH